MYNYFFIIKIYKINPTRIPDWIRVAHVAAPLIPLSNCELGGRTYLNSRVALLHHSELLLPGGCSRWGGGGDGDRVANAGEPAGGQGLHPPQR